jgi:hypothetical protein
MWKGRVLVKNVQKVLLPIRRVNKPVLLVNLGSIVSRPVSLKGLKNVSVVPRVVIKTPIVKVTVLIAL